MSRCVCTAAAFRVACFGLFLAMSSCQPGSQAPARGGQDSVFDTFVDEYFHALFQTNPTWGTVSGFHEFDPLMPDLSREGVRRRIDALREQQARLSQMTPHLSGSRRIDADLLESQIRAELLELEVVQGWRRNPMGYVSLPGSAVDALIKREFADPPVRLRSVVQRLGKVPDVLTAMRENVENPPREFADLALRIARGSIGFFEDTVPLWVRQSGVQDRSLLREFESANQRASQAMKDASVWIERELLPRSSGSFAIGPEVFAKKLLYEEMIETPLDELLRIGEANLEKDYEEFVKTARAIDPNRSPGEVMKLVESDHPSEDQLIDQALESMESIRQFLIDRGIVSIPSQVRPRILETPPYMRDGGFAFMDTPGAFETTATEAFYYITPPDAGWSRALKDEHLRLFNAPVQQVINIHEAFPGHFIQFLYAPQFPTKTRKLIAVGSNAEGWAHYAEEMMLEEGYGGGDPKIRLAQLSEALLRDCRFVVGIKLHTAGWTVDQGKEFFVQKGFQQPLVAFEEARRGAYNPTYLYYTLGKLEIYRLREDYRAKMREAYSLRAFHDAFVRQGSIPIPVIRRILLEN